jgi:hypothetical protein
MQIAGSFKEVNVFYYVHKTVLFTWLPICSALIMYGLQIRLTPLTLQIKMVPICATCAYTVVMRGIMLPVPDMSSLRGA